MTTIAIALGAGGARGIAHIHALRAFDDLGVKPIAMAGTSIGSIMAAGYCAGMNADDIEAFIGERIDDRVRLIREVFKLVPPDIESFMEDGGLRMGELNLQRILSVFLPEQVGETFDALQIPLKVVATDYYGQCDGVFAQGSLRPALAASACMPAIFLPVRIDGVYYVDGSSTNPCPVDTLQGLADQVIGIDVAGGTFGDPTKKPGKVNVAYGANQMMQMTMAKLLAARFENTTLLRAPVAQFRPLDFLKSREILDETRPLYEDTKRVIGSLLS